MEKRRCPDCGLNNIRVNTTFRRCYMCHLKYSNRTRISPEEARQFKEMYINHDTSSEEQQENHLMSLEDIKKILNVKDEYIKQLHERELDHIKQLHERELANLSNKLNEKDKEIKFLALENKALKDKSKRMEVKYRELETLRCIKDFPKGEDTWE